jgi:sugar lactone lactonase YvrE
VLVRGTIALAVSSVALASCCLEVVGVDASVGTTGSVGASSSSGGTMSASTGTGGGTTTGGSLCHAGSSKPGFVTTLAGGGDGGVLGDPIVDGAAAQVQFGNLSGVAVDSSGNVYVGEQGIFPQAKINCADGAFMLAEVRAGEANEVAVDPGGNVYWMAWTTGDIQKVDPSGTVTPVIGGDETKNSPFNQPLALAVDSSGSIFVADTGNNRIAKIDALGNVTTLAGSGAEGCLDGTGGAEGGDAQIGHPTGVAVDGVDNVFVAEPSCGIREIDPSGNVTTIAAVGNGQLQYPYALAVDVSGAVFVADNGAHRIFKIDPSGNLTSAAGNGTLGSIDGTLGPFGTAEFSASLVGLAVDERGNIYVADQYNERIRMVTP